MKYDHRKLGITFAELGALLGTRELLKQDALPHVGNVHDAEPGVHSFNMDESCSEAGRCGTVSCIGGTMALIMGMTAFEAKQYVSGIRREPDVVVASRVLENLFYPGRTCRDANYNMITPAQAVAAIDNFLDRRGHSFWQEAIIENN